MDKSITKLNARFFTGGSNERYCDCLGLVLLHMRNNGYQEVDQTSIPRGLTAHKSIRQELGNWGYTETKELDDNAWYLALMYYDDENGHLGIYFPCENLIYHMAPHGLASMVPNQNTSYWRYDGN